MTTLSDEEQKRFGVLFPSIVQCCLKSSDSIACQFRQTTKTVARRCRALWDSGSVVLKIAGPTDCRLLVNLREPVAGRDPRAKTVFLFSILFLPHVLSKRQ